MQFSPPSSRPLAIAAALLLAGAGGCGGIQRRMTIRSDPPGAMVYIDDTYEIGTTPVTTSFTYYGPRKIRLVMDGYKMLSLDGREVVDSVTVPVGAPWYEFVPLDFVSENLVPGKIVDQHVLDFKLVPQQVAPAGQLLGRAESLRQGAHAAAAGTAGPMAPGLRVNPPPRVQGTSPSDYGGQPIYPLQPGTR